MKSIIPINIDIVPDHRRPAKVDVPRFNIYRNTRQPVTIIVRQSMLISRNNIIVEFYLLFMLSAVNKNRQIESLLIIISAYYVGHRNNISCRDVVIYCYLH